MLDPVASRLLVFNSLALAHTHTHKHKWQHVVAFIFCHNCLKSKRVVLPNMSDIRQWAKKTFRNERKQEGSMERGRVCLHFPVTCFLCFQCWINTNVHNGSFPSNDFKKEEKKKRNEAKEKESTGRLSRLSRLLLAVPTNASLWVSACWGHN